jgi:hypothetical protein
MIIDAHMYMYNVIVIARLFHGTGDRLGRTRE